jgi:hypothetical protein
MTGKSNLDQETLELIKKLGISFSFVDEERWLPRHMDIFSAFKEIKRFTMKTFRTDMTEVHTQAWIEDIIDRARSIQDSVRDCLDEARNEEGWRQKLEPLVFRQFFDDSSWSVMIWRS